MKAEELTDIRAYVRNGKLDLKQMEYLSRGMEDGDLDGINEKDDALTARATMYKRLVSPNSSVTLTTNKASDNTPKS